MIVRDRGAALDRDDVCGLSGAHVGSIEAIVVDTQSVIWVTLMQKRLSKPVEGSRSEERHDGKLAIADRTVPQITLLVDGGRILVSRPYKVDCSFEGLCSLQSLSTPRGIILNLPGCGIL